MKKNLIYSFKNNRVLDSRAVYYNQRRIDKIIDGLMQELEDATATGESISVTDSANAPAKLLPSGNTYQATNIKTYKCEGTETGDYYFTYNSINYQFTMPTIEAGSVLAFNTDTLKLYLGDTEITTTTDNTGILITLQDTPNPNYPQDIHVVKGHNELSIKADLFATANNFQNRKAYRTGTDIIENDAYSTVCLDYLPILAGNQYDMKTQNGIRWLRLNFYNKNKTFLRSIYYDNEGQYSFTPGENEAYIRFSMRTQDFDTLQILYITRTLELDLPEGMEMYKISNYISTFEKTDGKWYITPHFKTEIDNANNVTRVGCEGKAGHYYFRFGNFNDMEMINSNYKQYGYINYGKANAPGRETGRGNIEGFNLGAKSILLYTEADSQLTLAEFKAKWNAKLANVPLVIYTKSSLTNIEITDQTLISQLDKMQKILSHFGGTTITTITAGDLKPIWNFDYKKSNRLRDDNQDTEIENIKARLDLLEG